MFLQDHKSLIFTRIGIFSLELMPAYSGTVVPGYLHILHSQQTI